MVVFGHIMPWPHQAGCDDDSLRVHNANVLASLPETGSFMCRSMFAQSGLKRPVSYGSHLIHFAFELKHIADFGWIPDFEDLLTKLWWSSAEVVDAGCGYRFEWTSSNDGPQRPQDTPVRRVFSSHRDLPEIDPSSSHCPR